jgi:hypothetical protein
VFSTDLVIGANTDVIFIIKFLSTGGVRLKWSELADRPERAPPRHRPTPAAHPIPARNKPIRQIQSREQAPFQPSTGGVNPVITGGRPPQNLIAEPVNAGGGVTPIRGGSHMVGEETLFIPQRQLRTISVMEPAGGVDRVPGPPQRLVGGDPFHRRLPPSSSWGTLNPPTGQRCRSGQLAGLRSGGVADA